MLGHVVIDWFGKRRFKFGDLLQAFLQIPEPYLAIVASANKLPELWEHRDVLDVSGAPNEISAMAATLDVKYADIPGTPEAIYSGSGQNVLAVR